MQKLTSKQQAVAEWMGMVMVLVLLWAGIIKFVWWLL